MSQHASLFIPHLEHPSVGTTWKGPRPAELTEHQRRLIYTHDVGQWLVELAVGVRYMPDTVDPKVIDMLARHLELCELPEPTRTGAQALLRDVRDRYVGPARASARDGAHMLTLEGLGTLIYTHALTCWRERYGGEGAR